MLTTFVTFPHGFSYDWDHYGIGDLRRIMKTMEALLQVLHIGEKAMKIFIVYPHLEGKSFNFSPKIQHESLISFLQSQNKEDHAFSRCSVS
jgi:hypothetical protein